MMVTACGQKCGTIAHPLRDFKAKNVAIKLQRTFKIGHLQMNVANPYSRINCFYFAHVYFCFSFVPLIRTSATFSPLDGEKDGMRGIESIQIKQQHLRRFVRRQLQFRFVTGCVTNGRRVAAGKCFAIQDYFAFRDMHPRIATFRE